MGPNQFSDLSLEEFQALPIRGFVKSSERGLAYLGEHEDGEVASSVDWRTKGAVTAVKDQGQCGSCWAFSATEAIESYNFLNGGKLVSLSPQQINSCDKVDQGCNGGNTETAYQYVEKAG